MEKPRKITGGDKKQPSLELCHSPGDTFIVQGLADGGPNCLRLHRRPRHLNLTNGHPKCLPWLIRTDTRHTQPHHRGRQAIQPDRRYQPSKKLDFSSMVVRNRLVFSRVPFWPAHRIACILYPVQNQRDISEMLKTQRLVNPKTASPTMSKRLLTHLTDLMFN